MDSSPIAEWRSLGTGGLRVLICGLMATAAFGYAQYTCFVDSEFNYEFGVPGRVDCDFYVLERRPADGRQIVLIKLENEVGFYSKGKDGINTEEVDFGFILLEGDDGSRYRPNASRVTSAKDIYRGKRETPSSREELIELEYEGPASGNCVLVLEFDPHWEVLAAFGKAERRCYRTGVVSTDEPVTVRAAPSPEAEVVGTWQPGEYFLLTGESSVYSPSPDASWDDKRRYFEVFADGISGWVMRGPDWDYGYEPLFEFAGFRSP
jgi:hypothetical protein